MKQEGFGRVVLISARSTQRHGAHGPLRNQGRHHRVLAHLGARARAPASPSIWWHLVRSRVTHMFHEIIRRKRARIGARGRLSDASARLARGCCRGGEILPAGRHPHHRSGCSMSAVAQRRHLWSSEGREHERTRLSRRTAGCAPSFPAAEFGSSRKGTAAEQGHPSSGYELAAAARLFGQRWRALSASAYAVNWTSLARFDKGGKASSASPNPLAHVGLVAAAHRVQRAVTVVDKLGEAGSPRANEDPNDAAA